MTRQRVNARRHIARLRTLADKIGFFYRWLYYRCYRHEEKGWRKYSRRYWDSASVLVLIIFLMNLGALFILSVPLFGFRVPTNVPHWVIGGAFLAVALWHTFYWRDRYKRVLAEFSGETIEEQRQGDRFFALYVVGSLVFFIAAAGLMILVGMQKGQLQF
jgi:hypothetical protein